MDGPVNRCMQLARSGFLGLTCNVVSVGRIGYRKTHLATIAGSNCIRMGRLTGLCRPRRTGCPALCPVWRTVAVPYDQQSLYEQTALIVTTNQSFDERTSTRLLVSRA